MQGGGKTAEASSRGGGWGFIRGGVLATTFTWLDDVEAHTLHRKVPQQGFPWFPCQPIWQSFADTGHCRTFVRPVLGKDMRHHSRRVEYVACLGWAHSTRWDAVVR